MVWKTGYPPLSEAKRCIGVCDSRLSSLADKVKIVVNNKIHENCKADYKCCRSKNIKKIGHFLIPFQI